MKAEETPRYSRAYFLIGITFLASVVFLDSSAISSAWSLLPPALAIAVAFVSRSLGLSLGAAVFLGSFLNSFGASQEILPSSGKMLVHSLGIFWQAGTDKTNLQILGFVFFILATVHVMSASGGLHALVRVLQKWIVGPKSAQFVTALMGCLIFIDDYANTMIVGSTMKKVTDRYKVSREKLAFLVDATSAPIAGVALVSTWIGYEVGLFSNMSEKFSWPIDGYGVFLDAIQFRFYCFFMLFFVFANILSGVDFGAMKSYQLNPIIPESTEDEGKRGHIASALLPLAFLLSLVFGLLWVDGGGLEGHKLWSLTSWRSVLTESKNGIFILLVAACVAYFVAVLTALVFKTIRFTDIYRAFLAGVKSAWLPIMILILAWSLKIICDDMRTGEYVVSILIDRVSGQWLPVAIFIVSALTAFSTGTSWGTMAILIPTVTPLAVSLSGGEYSMFVSLCLAAILDGAIMGDHCSPISDTTIMSAISSECDLINHVRSQLPYSLIVAVIALFCGYLPVGLGWPAAYSFAMAGVIIVVLFLALKFWPKRRRAL